MNIPSLLKFMKFSPLGFIVGENAPIDESERKKHSDNLQIEQNTGSRIGFQIFNIEGWFYVFQTLKCKSKLLIGTCFLNLIVCFTLFEGVQAQGLARSGMIRALAVKDHFLFAATDSGMIFRSSDNAKTWTSFKIEMPDLHIWSLQVKGDDLFMGTSNGVLHSSDNGEHWNKINDGLGNTSIYALTRKDNIVFAGGYGNAFRLADDRRGRWEGSIRWINSLNGFQDYYGIVYALLISGNLLFAGTDHGIYQSDDNSVNWKSINTNLPENIIVSALFTTKDNMYAGTSNGIFYLNNSNKSWNSVKGIPENTYIYSFCGIGDNIYAGTSNGLFYSKSDDRNWMEVKTALAPEKVAIYSLAVSGSTLWIGSAGSVLGVPLNVRY